MIGSCVRILSPFLHLKAAILRYLLTSIELAEVSGGFIFTRCGLGTFRNILALVQYHLCQYFLQTLSFTESWSNHQN